MHATPPFSPRGPPLTTAVHPPSPQYLGFEATISAPHMHAYALELLQDHLKPGARVLDVGCGSGYLTACFGKWAHSYWVRAARGED
jgi:protein-L-isoaspartate(D-aspartate) O-methyltransferase